MGNKIFADNILQGKVAFVTGGGTGITGGVARALAKVGAKVAITSRKTENLEPMRSRIENDGGECFAVASDVRDYEAVENCIEKAVDRFGFGVGHYHHGIRADAVVHGAFTAGLAKGVCFGVFAQGDADYKVRIEPLPPGGEAAFLGLAQGFEHQRVRVISKPSSPGANGRWDQF